MLIKLIKQRRFEEAIQLIDFEEFEVFYEEILDKAYDDADMSYYDFLAFIINNKYNTAKYHYYASRLMATALNFLPNGYEIAFKHAKQSILLAPEDWSYKEYILLFHAIPEQLLSKEKAKEYANEILQIQPENVIVIGRKKRDSKL